MELNQDFEPQVLLWWITRPNSNFIIRQIRKCFFFCSPNQYWGSTYDNFKRNRRELLATSRLFWSKINIFVNEYVDFRPKKSRGGHYHSTRTILYLVTNIDQLTNIWCWQTNRLIICFKRIMIIDRDTLLILIGIFRLKIQNLPKSSKILIWHFPNNVNLKIASGPLFMQNLAFFRQDGFYSWFSADYGTTGRLSANHLGGRQSVFFILRLISDMMKILIFTCLSLFTRLMNFWLNDQNFCVGCNSLMRNFCRIYDKINQMTFLLQT